MLRQGLQYQADDVLPVRPQPLLGISEASDPLAFDDRLALVRHPVCAEHTRR